MTASIAAPIFDSNGHANYNIDFTEPDVITGVETLASTWTVVAQEYSIKCILNSSPTFTSTTNTTMYPLMCIGIMGLISAAGIGYTSTSANVPVALICAEVFLNNLYSAVV